MIYRSSRWPWHVMVHGMSYGLARHGMVYGMSWLAWYMVMPGGHGMVYGVA